MPVSNWSGLQQHLYLTCSSLHLPIHLARCPSAKAPLREGRTRGSSSKYEGQGRPSHGGWLSAYTTQKEVGTQFTKEILVGENTVNSKEGGKGKDGRCTRYPRAPWKNMLIIETLFTENWKWTYRFHQNKVKPKPSRLYTSSSPMKTSTLLYNFGFFIQFWKIHWMYLDGASIWDMNTHECSTPLPPQGWDPPNPRSQNKVELGVLFSWILVVLGKKMTMSWIK